ncbi:uncharacterized protein LOC106652101 isoform X1 [Trichogramma pretiosum]|uniref:uncharacterized protein LOC106652101 isoform X1 n=2 Tax=Trichogramma pretiosum TaxID=7493 RepID=UPI0006C97A6B|nr:uncharacterized protein LOC106652101 isoform X1 [Trichogramma pretiosum]
MFKSPLLFVFLAAGCLMLLACNDVEAGKKGTQKPEKTQTTQKRSVQNRPTSTARPNKPAPTAKLNRPTTTAKGTKNTGFFDKVFENVQHGLVEMSSKAILSSVKAASKITGEKIFQGIHKCPDGTISIGRNCTTAANNTTVANNTTPVINTTPAINTTSAINTTLANNTTSAAGKAE